MRSLIVFLNLVILSRLSDGAPVPQAKDLKNTVVDPTTCRIVNTEVSDSAVNTVQSGKVPESLFQSCGNSNAVAAGSGTGAGAGHGGGRVGGLRGFSSGSADSGNGNPAAYAGTSYDPSSGDPSTTSSNPSTDGYPPAPAEPATGYGPPPASNDPGYPPNGSNGPNSGYPVASGADGSSYPSTFGPAAPEPANSNYYGATSDFGGSYPGGSRDSTVKSAGDASATSSDSNCGGIVCSNVNLVDHVADVFVSPTVGESEASNPMLNSAGVPGLKVPQVSETKTTGCPSGDDVDGCVKGGGSGQ